MPTQNEKPQQPKPPRLTELPTEDAITRLFPQAVINHAKKVIGEKDDRKPRPIPGV